jgi:deoxyadenosine/deoxycytidine kinase
MVFGKYRYVAVEGRIGMGKTSLARLLAQRFKSELALEAPEENPFLAQFYEDKQRYALPAQLFFLFQRARQMRQLLGLGTATAVVVDYLLDKDMLFAQLNLDCAAYRLYQDIHAHLQLPSIMPDLVIYLQSRPATLLARIQKRGMPNECLITRDYLDRLSERYSRFFSVYDASPVLAVNCEDLNFMDRQEDFEQLIEKAARLPERHKHFGRGN